MGKPSLSRRAQLEEESKEFVVGVSIEIVHAKINVRLSWYFNERPSRRKSKRGIEERC
jgi:hypothetical protein